MTNALFHLATDIGKAVDPVRVSPFRRFAPKSFGRNSINSDHPIRSAYPTLAAKFAQAAEIFAAQSSHMKRSHDL
jgi:hypothetical protein